MVATLGLSQEEAERQAIAGPPDGRRARAIGMSYRYSPEEVELHGDLIRSGLAVPMPGDDGEGYLVVFSRGELDVDDEGVGELEQLAERAGPAIDNARRFREARRARGLRRVDRAPQPALLPRDARAGGAPARTATGATSRSSSSTWTTSRRSTTASATSPATPCSPGAAKRVRDVVRSADIACRVGGDEFASHPPRGERRATPTGSTDASRRRSRSSRAATPSSTSRPVWRSSATTTTRSRSSSGPTTALYRAKEAGKAPSRRDVVA